MAIIKGASNVVKLNVALKGDGEMINIFKGHKNNLLKIRTQLNLSKNAMAEKLEMRSGLYARYENGEVEPSVLKAIHIAKLLNKQVEEIW
jgi:DNA-binding XRE family transcriptional regulator